MGNKRTLNKKEIESLISSLFISYTQGLAFEVGDKYKVEIGFVVNNEHLAIDKSAIYKIKDSK